MSEDKIMLEVPKSIRQLKKLVKDRIADQWESIAIQLGFTPAQIQGIKDNHQERSVEDSCRQMLFKWLESNQSKNPAEDLIKAVKEVGYGFQADQFEKGC